MMPLLYEFGLSSAGLLGGIYLVRVSENRHNQRNTVTYRLQFPPNLAADDAAAFVGSLSGLLVPWWKRLLQPAVVGFEVEASKDGIEHFLVVPRSWSATVENMLQAHLPAVRYQVVERKPVTWLSAAEYTVSSGERPLRIEPEALASALLASLTPLRKKETIRVQWLLSPHGVLPPEPTDRGSRAPERTALRRKFSSPPMLAVGRIATTAMSPRRARQLVRQAEVAWHGTRAPGVQLRRRRLPERLAARRVTQWTVPVGAWPLILSAEELSGLIGWPLGAGHLPGVALGGHRELPASRHTPSKGTVLGTSTFPGDPRPIGIDLAGRMHGLHVMAPTGAGKSTLLSRLIASDMKAGYGVVVLDAKNGDLIRAVLHLVPERRRHEVIVLDPSDSERPVGINPLRASYASPEVLVENLVGLIRDVFGSWGPRTSDVLRSALLTLAGTKDATLCEVAPLLTDPTYRRRIVGRLDDPTGLEPFWSWFDSLSDAERLTITAPALSRLRSFTSRPRVRVIVGQVEPKLDFRDVLARGGIVLVSLASGTLGTEAADLLGSMIFASLWQAITARASVPPEKRRPVMVHLDEAQRLMRLPGADLAEAFSTTRGYNVSLTAAHQNLAQLSPEMRESLFANARSRLVFGLGGSDSRAMARELGGGLTENDLTALGRFQGVAEIFAHGRRQPPCTLRALPPAEPISDGEEVRRLSRERFGVPRAEVEAAIRERHQGRRNLPETIGTKRRAVAGEAS